MPSEETLAKKVRVVTRSRTFEFDDFANAKENFPSLDAYRGSKDFTGALDYGDGFMHFESWEIHEALDQED